VRREVYLEPMDASEHGESDWEESEEASDGSTGVYTVHDSESDADTVARGPEAQEGTEAQEEEAQEEEAQEDSSEDERWIQEEVQRLREQRRAERATRKAAKVLCGRT
jgi:hypothetical protein